MVLRLLDGDDAVLADLVERLGDQLADLRVLRRRSWRRGRCRPCSSTSRAASSSASVTAVGGGVDAALERHRVGAGGDVAQALVDHRLGEHGRGGGAVTGDVVGLGGDLLGELGAEVLVGSSSSISRATVTPSLVMVGAPHFLSMTTLRPLRAERHLDGVGERVHAALERAPGVLVELQDLGHEHLKLRWSRSLRTAASRCATRCARTTAPEPVAPRRRSERHRADSRCEPRLLLDDGEHVAGGEDRYSSPLYLTSVPPYLL